MSVKPHLQTSLSQRLVLTPQMRQRIEMLQMTKLELSDMILAELDQNIMLESLEPGDGAEEVAEIAAEGEAAAPEASNAGEDIVAPEFSAVEMTVEAPVGEGEPDLGADVEQRDAFDEIDYGQTFEDYLDPGYKTQERETREEFSFENFLSRPPSLTDQLMWQLGLSDIEGDMRDAAEAIIGNLDENGYLAATYEEIAEMGSWPLDVVEAAHRAVMHLDPIGIGARGARECLLVQLEAMGEADQLAARLVRDHWDHLPKHKLPELSRQIGIPIDQLITEVDRIRRLDPYPGRRFSVDDSQYIEPEVSIEKVDDDYVIRFNDDGLPLLRINRTYRQMMLAKDTSKEAKDFIKDKFRSAIGKFVTDKVVVHEVHLPGPDGVNFVFVEQEGHPEPVSPKGYGVMPQMVAISPDNKFEKAFFEGVMGLKETSYNRFSGPEVEKTIGLPKGAGLDIRIFGDPAYDYGRLEIVQYEGAKSADLYPRAKPPARGLLSVTYFVPDVGAILARATAADAPKMRAAPVDHGVVATIFGASRMATLVSPAGLRIDLVERR